MIRGEKEEIKNRAVNGMLWTSFERIATQIVQFVISIVIARILMPSDYGIMGMLAIFLIIAQTFLDSGFGSALIQKRNCTDEDYSTVFFVNIIVALVLYVIIYLCAPLIAAFYNIPLLMSITRVVFIILIINSFSLVQTTKLTIELNFKVQAYASILSVIVSGCLGIFSAYRGLGAWSLVIQQLSASFIRGVVLWIFAKWHPIFCFSRDSFNTLFSFGSKVLGSSLINNLYQNMYTLVIGKAFSASDVGYYNRGLQFADLPTNSVVQITTKVIYPVLAKFKEDDDQLLKAYQKMLRVPFFVLCPLLFGIAAVSYPLVEIVLGSKWLPCVTFLQVLCFGKIFQPLTHINLNLLYVKGRSDLVLKLELIKKPIGFLILFASLPLGIIWICIGKTLYEFVAFAFNCYYTKKILGYGFWDQSKAILPIVINSIIMVFAICIGMACFDMVMVKLLLGIFVGIVSFVLLSILTRDSSLFDLKNIIVQKLHH